MKFGTADFLPKFINKE